MTNPTKTWQSYLLGLVLWGVLGGVPAALRAESFDFQQELFGTPSTLSLNIETVDTVTGQISVNGADSQGPTTPFTWDWGDGQVTNGFFPQQHTYTDTTKNYVIGVTSYYSGGGEGGKEVQARFVAPQIAPVTLDASVQVSIPLNDVALSSRMPGYLPPATVTHFDAADFGVVPRATIEYVLTAAAAIQRSFANENVANVGGGFQQVVLKDSALSGGGMYSLWYTDPVAFGAAGAAVDGSIPYSSFMHEMGHNFTLNSPSDYYYGGKIDGNANAIFSESMAQVFQHATAYELINHAADYGLSDDLVFDVQASASASMSVVRDAFDDYVDGGADFCSWNDPSTPQDETFGTFMTIAYKFFEQAENSGDGYAVPLMRMMELLQTFDVDMESQYDRLHDNVDADAFRATLMVSAMSYGFATDLRADFRALGFPVDDATYHQLLATVPEPASAVLLVGLAVGGLAIVRRRRT